MALVDERRAGPHARVSSAIVLTGGRSERMGNDKGLRAYEGRPQLTRVVEQVSAFARRVLVSCRAAQLAEYQRLLEGLGDLCFVVDAPTVETPLQAWAGALAEVEDGWSLCLGIDQPALGTEALTQLLEERRGWVTCFASPDGGALEPFPGVWRVGPALRRGVRRALARGRLGWQPLLVELGVHALVAREPRWLINANTPEQARAAEAFLRSPSERDDGAPPRGSG